MRPVRVSPLMRRASPSGCASNSRSSDDISKGLERPSSTSAVEDTRKCVSGGELLVPEELKNHLFGRRRSHPGRVQALDAESPLSAASTPTRNTIRSAGGINKDIMIPDADRVHEKLQQMWDDGELSPRAPLDRSLGYVSSSPNSTGKGAPSSSATPESAAGGTQSCRQNLQQQGVGGPLFINDVRALRQMAPFSSTEEQVLTRSQRRRSSANLLQQLVAAQSCGQAHLGHSETSSQQEQCITRKEQRQQHEPVFHGQQLKGQCAISDIQQQQYQSQTVVEALDLSFGQASGLNSVAGTDTVSRGIGARKRRASSPVISTDSFSPNGYPKKNDIISSADGAPQPLGRKRLSALRPSTHTLVTVGTTPATTKASLRRNSVTTAVPYIGESDGDRGTVDIPINCVDSNSSSSTIESPFQKHPPPSPSDFPVSSPINSRSYSPRQNAATAPKQQTHHMQSHGASATSGRPHIRSPIGKQKHALGSPLRTSPRRTHGEGGPFGHPFQTPRAACSSLESHEDATGVSVRQRASQRCMSPLPPVPTTASNPRSVGEQREDDAREQIASLATEDGPEMASNITLKAASTGKTAVTSRRASAVPASRLKLASGNSNASIVPLRSGRQAGGEKGVTETPGMRNVPPSPRKSATPASTWHRPGRSGGAPRVTASERQCKSHSMPATSKHSPDLAERAASEPHSKGHCPTTRGPGDSPAAAAATRRRSAARRSTGLVPSAGACSPWDPTSPSARRSVCVSPVASQDVTDEASLLGTARNPARFAKGAALQERKPVARVGNSPCEAATESSVSSRNSEADICLGASKGGRSSTRGPAAGRSATVSTARRGFTRATPSRPSAGKLRANSGKGLFHSAAGRGSASALSIIKPRHPISAPEKQKGVNRITVSCKPSAGGVRGLRNSRNKLPACSSGPRAISAVAALRQGRPEVKCHSPIRTDMEFQVSDSAAVKSSDANATGSKVDAKHAELVEQDARNKGLHSSCLSKPELLSIRSVISTPPAQSERACLKAADEGHRSCSKCTIGWSAVSTSTNSSAGIGVSASAACAALAENSWGSVTAHPPSRRRSSSPHSLALQKGAGNDNGDDNHQSGTSTSLRRASSACSLEDGDGKRVSAQQQKNEALHQEWEGRDREYQEKQQNLLLEQQRRERLLAWEQREAELLKNRKALSKEEPSFWGFDPCESRLLCSQLMQTALRVIIVVFLPPLCCNVFAGYSVFHGSLIF